MRVTILLLLLTSCEAIDYQLYDRRHAAVMYAGGVKSECLEPIVQLEHNMSESQYESAINECEKKYWQSFCYIAGDLKDNWISVYAPYEKAECKRTTRGE